MSLTKTLTFSVLEIENLFFCRFPLSLVFHCFAYQVYGEYLSGSINDDERKNVVRNSCPGAGACGGMYTANTMASAIEAMGMSLPYR